MRGAAQGWEKEYSARLRAKGYTQGSPAPIVCHHQITGVRISVRGDNFIFYGKSAAFAASVHLAVPSVPAVLDEVQTLAFRYNLDKIPIAPY